MSFSFSPASAADANPSRKIVLIAGPPSHPPLMHDFRAGCLLLRDCLAEVPGVTVDVHDNGWVRDEAAFEGTDAVIIDADGGGGHPALQGDHLKTLERLSAKGVGFGCMHYENLDPKGPLPRDVQDKIEGWKKGKPKPEGPGLPRRQPTKFEELARARSSLSPP